MARLVTEGAMTVSRSEVMHTEGMPFTEIDEATGYHCTVANSIKIGGPPQLTPACDRPPLRLAFGDERST